ncbi:MAG: hypothetical protein CMF51_03140 [Legionellales bacterium]|nr:hypothetical protein [Legionellales bacterium]
MILLIAEKLSDWAHALIQQADYLGVEIHHYTPVALMHAQWVIHLDEQGQWSGHLMLPDIDEPTLCQGIINTQPWSQCCSLEVGSISETQYFKQSWISLWAVLPHLKVRLINPLDLHEINLQWPYVIDICHSQGLSCLIEPQDISMQASSQSFDQKWQLSAQAGQAGLSHLIEYWKESVPQSGRWLCVQRVLNAYYTSEYTNSGPISASLSESEMQRIQSVFSALSCEIGMMVLHDNQTLQCVICVPYLAPDDCHFEARGVRESLLIHVSELSQSDLKIIPGQGMPTQGLTIPDRLRPTLCV